MLRHPSTHTPTGACVYTQHAVQQRLCISRHSLVRSSVYCSFGLVCVCVCESRQDYKSQCTSCVRPGSSVQVRDKGPIVWRLLSMLWKTPKLAIHRVSQPRTRSAVMEQCTKPCVCVCVCRCNYTGSCM